MLNDLPSGSPIQKQIEEADRAWMQLFIEGDVDKLEQNAAADFRLITDAGLQVEGAAFFGHLRSKIVSGQRYDIISMDIRAHSHSGTSITQLNASLMAEGRRIEGPLLRIAVWNLINGQWKLSLLAFYNNSLGQSWHKLTSRHS